MDTRAPLTLDSTAQVGVDRVMGGKSITILHLSDLQFGKNHRFAGIELGGLPNPYETLLERLWEDLQGLRKDHKVEPDLVVVTGDLAEWGMPDEFKAVREFLERLTDKDHLNLPRSRVAVVPGNHDVNRKACSAYFENCEADGTQPIPPWQPKWRHFVAMFDELYRGVGPKFTIEEPWTLFEVPDLKVVIAGLNATMVDGHDCQKPGEKPDPKLPHHVGWVGEPQLRWFKTRLAERRAQGWLRIVAVHHNYQRGCKDDDENLEDAADLKRLLGQEINLLLHGHRHEADLAFLNQHVPVFSTGSAALKKEARPEEIPNQYQVLQVFPDQVRRFGRAFFPEGKSFGPDARIGKNDGVAVETVALLDVGATFPGGRTARFDGRGADGRAEIEALRDRGERTDGFLARVAEVCRLQHPKATTTPFPADDRHPAYLRITDPSGGIVCPRPVGVFDHGLTREELERFLSTIDAPYRSADTGLLSEIVCGGERPSEALVQEAWRRRVKVQSFVEFQGLIDFGGYVRKQTERLERDDVYPPKLYVPQRMCFQIGEEKHQADDALGQVQAWLAEPNPRFVIILGDFGTGKTFLLHELARRMGNDDTALVPLFVELRALEKAQSLDTLVAQHLAKSGEERIDIPAFRYMLKQGRIVLFFDGFDELALRVSYDRAAEHFETLVQAADGDAKVVVTSRTQHFESEKQVRTVLYERARPLTGLRYCKLHPFKEDQILQFLRNRWHDAEDPEKEAQDWLALIHNVKDLFGLSETPRMLGFITELKKEDIEKAKKKDSGISSAELYRLLMDRWLIFEYERAHPKGMQVTLSLEARFAAVTAVAMRLWEKTEKFVTTAELSEVTSGAVAQSMTTPPPADIAAHLIGSGSLLRRDDEGCFTFVHQSVMEWLVAREAAQQLKQGAATPGLGTRELSQLMADFFCDLAGRAPAIAWASGVVGRSAAGNDVAKGNALAVLKRLGVKVGLNFAGQILRGKDFGDQWLAHADFSGADLSEARLARKDLTHAKLARARLVAADLTRATLTGADLTEADLSQARLAGADLRGAKLGGAKLRRAVLLGATLDAGALDGLDTLGAALPGDRAPSPVSMGSPSPTTCVAWHPTLDLLATGHNDNSVRIWEPRTGKPLQTLKGHEDFVCSVAFSPDGAALASASFDNTVRIWDPRTGKPLQTLRGHRNHVRCVAFSPDGAALASAGDDNTVRILDPRTGKPLQTLKGHVRSVWSVAFSPDGVALASASADKTVRIWDPRTGKHLQALKGHEDSVWSVAFSPDGAALASASDDKTVRIWDLRTGKPLQTLKGHENHTRGVTFSPDGAALASASDDRTVRIWDPRTGKHLQTLKGHEDSVWSVAFSPDSAALASASDDKTVRIWDPRTGKHLQTLKSRQDSVWSVAFSPDGAALASASADNTIRIWDLRTGKPFQTLKGHEDYVRCVAFSPDGAALASASADSTIRIWDPRTGKHLQTLKSREDSVWSVAFSPDGAALVSASDDKAVRIWDPRTGKPLQALKGHVRSVWSVAFSPDGAALASGSADSTVRIWDPRTGKPLQTLKGHEDYVRSVAFSPDGAALASASFDNTVRIWDLRTGKPLQTLKGHKNHVRCVAFGPGGATLASGSSDNTVRIWDPRTGKPLQTLKGHDGYVRGVAFSPDGAALASGSNDNTVRIWDLRTGACLAVLAGFPEGWVAFTPDGRYKLGGSVAGNFWHMIALCRFEVGELDEFIPGLRLAADEPLFPRLPGANQMAHR